MRTEADEPKTASSQESKTTPSPQLSGSRCSKTDTAQKRSTCELFGYDNEKMHPSLLALLTLGAAVILCSALPSMIAAILIVPMALFSRRWYIVHGDKMTRAETLFFDEKNVLESCDGLQFEYGPLLEGTTPYGGPPDANPDEPKTIWQALFHDDRKLNMQNFYKQHYGPVYATGLKRFQEDKIKAEMAKDRSEKQE